ncbi:MAG: ABC transporter permease, partial [Proteobacteria bacterium]
MSDTTTPLVAADGTPLKRKLAQSLMRSRARAFGLALPLLAFILVLFVYPIANFLTQAFYDA